MLLLTLLNKGLAAFRTSDLYSALTPGDSDLLPAGRTPVDMMGLSLLHIPFPCAKKLLYLKFILQIPVIFKTAFISIL